MKYVISYDIGTTGVKVCLFSVDKSIEMIGAESAGYGLYTYPDGGAEQIADEWWEAMRKCTGKLLQEHPEEVKAVAGISYCSQMQGLVLVDEEGNAVRNPMSYMDQRSTEEFKKGIGSGIRISGMNAHKLITSLAITKAVAGSVKDPVWKYLWVRNHEPENFAKARWWLDVKDYLMARMTGNCVMTRDSAYATMIYDTRAGREGWSSELCRMFGIDMKHLPPVIKSTDVAGYLRKEQAEELGLTSGIPVFGGGGDLSLIGVGCGAVKTGDTHIYCGTSGWVGTVTDRQSVDTSSMIAAVVGAQEGRFNYFAEMETAGKCLEWVRDHLAMDEIGVYMDREGLKGTEEEIKEGLYGYMSEVIAKAPAGAGGVIFTPWLHGNRCPFEAPESRGMFFNISLETGKTEMLRAVTEGVCYHLRWMIECQDKKVKTSERVRFCGGGALSDMTSQILADITGKVIEVVDSPQNSGSLGAAIISAAGLGEITEIEEAAELIPAAKTFYPDDKDKDIYDRNFEVFKRLYSSNAVNFKKMNK